MTPVQRRAAVTDVMTTAGLSERRACRFTGFPRSSQRYPGASATQNRVARAPADARRAPAALGISAVGPDLS